MAAGPGAAVVELARDSLHASVSDPVATSMNFLNEVAARYPDAISLAAGRPYDGFYTAGDVGRYLQSYVDHLGQRGVGPDQARVLLLQYGRTNGQLGELIARLLAVDEGIDVPAEAIAVTAGCQEAMVIALRGLCADPADVVLAVEPCYVGFTGAARLLGIDVVRCRRPRTAWTRPRSSPRCARSGPVAAARGRSTSYRTSPTPPASRSASRCGAGCSTSPAPPTC
jgi:aspartate/methionine/tyrosine aminotransferase